MTNAGCTREPNYFAMLSSPRCGARTRRGTPCQSPAVCGKSGCRMHVGATGSGAPKGNQNALKHGLCTRKAIAERRHLPALLRESLAMLGEIE